MVDYHSYGPEFTHVTVLYNGVVWYITCMLCVTICHDSLLYMVFGMWL